MSDKSLVDESGDPIKDPVDQFMRQLASSAAKHRRAVTGAPPVIVDNALVSNNEAPAPKIWKTEVRLAPPIESVSVTEAEEVPGCWVVDARDSENALLRTVFDGREAEQRAREYVRWKYGWDA